MAKRVPKTKAGKKGKVEKVLGEYKRGQLHSGSKEGPKVRSRSQAIAIAMKQSGQSRKKRPRSKRKTSVSEALST